MVFFRIAFALFGIAVVLAGDAEQSLHGHHHGGKQDPLGDKTVSSDVEQKESGDIVENKVFPPLHYQTPVGLQQAFQIDGGGQHPSGGIAIPLHQIPVQGGHILLPQVLHNGIQQGQLQQWDGNKLHKHPQQPVFDTQQQQLLAAHHHQHPQHALHATGVQQDGQHRPYQPGHITQGLGYPQEQHHLTQQQSQEVHGIQQDQPVHHQLADVVHGPTHHQDHHQYIENHNVNPQTDLTPVPVEDQWPLPQPVMPKIVHLDVKCEKNLMKVVVEFDKPFHGLIFSKGHYSYGSCVHLPAGSGHKTVYFDISISSCGTIGNAQNGLYGHDGAATGMGSFFENTIIVQYDPQVQEVWDQARKLRCTWHNHYEKAVTFRPFPVDMLDVVRADFAGDNVGCWMQIQGGKGPWASEVAGIVKIGQTMTMVLAIKDDENKFDMLVRNCIAHDGQRAPIELVDSHGCVVRPKLMSRFNKIRNFGSSATVLSYAHFQAFKFPDTMEVHFQCTIQICRYECPDQCLTQAESAASDRQTHYSNGVPSPTGRSREKRDAPLQEMTEIGVNKVIHVVSAGDLAFTLAANDSLPAHFSRAASERSIICISTPWFTSALVVLLSLLVTACILSAFLWVKQRTTGHIPKGFFYDLPVFKKGVL